ncbi:MAG: hypothetical protein EOO07_36720 [Chitinophagaceae bacterium]|nr:MAG: hypothetical protein EOO07_36720 [Chitinophagaceae bacterium]
MKTKNMNYRTVCHYCGLIFENNRSRGKFCKDEHRSMYKKYGSIITPMLRLPGGDYFNAEECLSEAYHHSGTLVEYKEGWSLAYLEDTLLKAYGYPGPYPTGTALLVVTCYVIKLCLLKDQDNETRFQIKPISELTREERAREVFLKPVVDELGVEE